AENPSKGMDHSGCTDLTTTVKLINYQGKEKDANNQFYTTAPCFDHPTLPSLLDNAGKSWRYYANTETSIWNEPNAIVGSCVPISPVGGQCTGSDCVNDVVIGPGQIFTDLGISTPQLCNLKNVSWVIPDGNWSDHPGFGTGQHHSTDIEGGPAWGSGNY